MTTHKTLVIGYSPDKKEYFIKSFHFPGEGAEDEKEMRECIDYVSNNFNWWLCGDMERYVVKILEIIER